MSETATPNAAPNAPGAPAAPDPAAPPAAGAPPPAADWRASLPAEIRDAPGLTKFQDPGALARSYVELEGLVGRKGAIVPGEKDGPDVQARWRQAIGVPEKPSDYGLAAPKDIPAEAWDGERATAFATEAHRLGLTPAQAKGLAEWAAKDSASALQRFTAGIEADGRPMDEVLRGEWGARYDAQVDAAKRAARQFGDEAALGALEARIGGAAMVRMFAKIGSALAEDAPAGMGTGSRAPADPKAELDQIMAPGSPYWQPLHPENAAAQARARELFRKMSGEA